MDSSSKKFSLIFCSTIRASNEIPYSHTTNGNSEYFFTPALLWATSKVTEKVVVDITHHHRRLPIYNNKTIKLSSSKLWLHYVIIDLIRSSRARRGFFFG